MPVRKFRSVEEMETPWREPGDPDLYRTMARLWDFGQRSRRRHFPPGLHRYRSIEDLNARTEEWEAANMPTPGTPGTPQR